MLNIGGSPILCGMPDLDLEPKDYRADPVEGEPVMTHGGTARLLAIALAIIVGVAVTAFVGPFIRLLFGQ